MTFAFAAGCALVSCLVIVQIAAFTACTTTHRAIRYYRDDFFSETTATQTHCGLTAGIIGGSGGAFGWREQPLACLAMAAVGASALLSVDGRGSVNQLEGICPGADAEANGKRTCHRRVPVRVFS